MKAKSYFPLILALGQEVLVPIIENKLNESVKNLKIFPLDLKKLSAVPEKERKVYQISLMDRYVPKYKLYSLIFTITRQFIPDHYDFKALVLIDINLSTKEISKTFEVHRFQKTKIFEEELKNIKDTLKNLFGSFIEGEI